MAYTQHIAIDVEVTIMSYSNGMPYSICHPNNPFLKRNYQPLPYFDNGGKPNFGSLCDREIYWMFEEELTIDTPSLNLKKAFNCYNQIAPAGAHYSIKLCADVPDNDNPMYLPPKMGSDTGHSFIVLTKSNGTKSVTQVFGFYAQKHPGYFMPWRDMPSTIKNNQLREINASIEMGLTQEQFDLLRKKAFELAEKKWSAASNNCTNFGLDLFNSVRTIPITIDSCTVYLPNNNNVYGTAKTNTQSIDQTPQMLFKKLKELKSSKNAEASNIVIDTTTKTKAPLSHGECN